MVIIRRVVAREDVDAEDARPELNAMLASGPFDLPAGATLEQDIAYGSDAAQRLDVYVPAKANGAPAIFMLHGGAWRYGNKALWRVVKNKVAHWVGKGYVFVSANHPLLPAADPLTQAASVAQALAFVQSRLATWGGDRQRLVVIGHSAGAHLAALLVSDPAICTGAAAAPWLATVLLDSAALDVEEIMRAEHLPLYDQAFSADSAYWLRASPAHRLAAAPLTPVLIVCSRRRGDSCAQGRAFADKVAGFGGRAEVLPVALTHAEINDLLGTPGAYTERVDAFLTSVGLE